MRIRAHPWQALLGWARGVCWAGAFGLVLASLGSPKVLTAQPDTTHSPPPKSTASLTWRQVHLPGWPGIAATRKLARLLRHLGQAKPPADSAQLQLALAKGLHALQNQGYAQARLGQWQLNQDTLVAPMAAGPWHQLMDVNLASPLSLALPAYPKRRRAQPYAPKALADWAEEVLADVQNQGYPLATLALDTQQLTRRPPHPASGTDTVVLALAYRLNPGPAMRLHALELEGDAREQPAFVAALARLNLGGAYDRAAIQAAPQLLTSSVHYQQARWVNAEWDTAAGTVVLKLALKRRRGNRFDVVLGLYPPRPGEDGFQVAGQADIRLVSALRQGETIALKYEQLNTGVQRLDAAYSHPFPFGLPIRLGLELDLERQDTLFLNRTLSPWVGFPLGGRLWVDLTYTNHLTSQLGAPGTVPDSIRPASINRFGARFSYTDADDWLNPWEGTVGTLSAGFGRLAPQATTGPADTGTSAPQPFNQLRVVLDATRYQPLGGRWQAVGRLQLHWQDQARFAANDLHPIGGAATLRGFEENRFWVSLAGIATAEGRWVWAPGAFVGAFVDAAYLERREADQPTGRRGALAFGGLVQVATRIGWVRLTYGVGTTAGTPLSALGGRLHVGFLTAF